jgi:hypothetical protein
VDQEIVDQEMWWRSMQQDEPTHGVWLSWRLAVEQVERSRGVSWGEAARSVDAAIAKGKLTCRQALGDGPDVWEVDLRHWLANPYSKDRATPKRNLADFAVKTLWHSANNIPKHLTHKVIVKQMADWITVHCKRNNQHRPEISSDTMLRAAGRKK